MTYGSPSSLDDVPRYITAVRGGREPSHELVTEFKRRYAAIDGSPLIPITQAQAAALESRIGSRAVVRATMRFSAPTIGDALEELAADGITDAVGIILSPQYSPLLMGGYERDVELARASIGPMAPRVVVARDWHLEPAFVDALAEHIRTGLAMLAPDATERVPVLLSAHSLPRRVAEQEPDYLNQLTETAVAVAERAGLSHDQWSFCWQSAGHEPGEWMKPDFADLLPSIAARGHRAVLVAPVQFLADHLETLYDVDIAARGQAEAAGLRFARVPALNTDPGFIAALECVALRELASSR